MIVERTQVGMARAGPAVEELYGLSWRTGWASAGAAKVHGLRLGRCRGSRGPCRWGHEGPDGTCEMELL
jgi:hypothetical protein